MTLPTKQIAHIQGVSTTGVARGDLIETSKVAGHVLRTITGVDGKRHASMLIDADGIRATIEALTVALGMIEA